jgi:hypothetical protein
VVTIGPINRLPKLLIEVFTFRAPDFVVLTRRILENASIQVS